jgi:PPOX class probable F420-dependent enzyme
MIEQFKGHNFLALETFKKDGTGVITPLFFVMHEGVLYMRSPMSSWKVKRMRHNPQVRVVPSDVRGEPKGAWVSGQAQIFHESEMAWVNKLVIKKYGLMKRLLDWRNRLLGRAGKFAVIAVRVREV